MHFYPVSFTQYKMTNLMPLYPVSLHGKKWRIEDKFRMFDKDDKIEDSLEESTNN